MIAFLTGTTTFLGEALLRALRAKDWKVRALVPPGEDLSHLSDVKFEKVEGDLSTFEALRIGAAGAHVIFHAGGSPDPWSGSYESHRVANVIGAKNLLSVAHRMKIERVVVVGGPDVSVRLKTPYARTRAEAIEAGFSRNWEGVHKDMEVVAAHPGLLLGPRDRGPSPFGRILRGYLRDELSWLPAGGVPVVDVEDAARNIALLADHGLPGAEYNFVSEWVPTASLIGALDFLSEHEGKPRLVPALPARLLACAADKFARLGSGESRVPSAFVKLAAHGRRATPDGTAERRVLQLAPYFSFEESLARAHTWWAEQGIVPRAQVTY